MLTYLASYPRSGSAMTRNIFLEAFRITTKSRYACQGILAGNTAPTIREAGPMTWQDAKPVLAADVAMHFVKTHHPPEDDHPALYIVRDPRAALVSYWHFLVEVDKVAVTLDQVIEGACGYGSWSDHLRAWRPRTRPRTLVLRYEDVVADARPEIEKIGRFIGVAPSGHWDRKSAFEKGHAARPLLARVGSNEANFAELSPSQRARICELCREGMMEFGYPLG